MPKPFHTFPHTPSIEVTPFTAAVPQEAINDLKRRINDAPTPRKTYENSTTKEQLGITRDWLIKAVEEWKTFDWRKTEDEINSFANYKAKVEHDGHNHEVHFTALFSEKKDAIPIIMTHGWPGSFLEFLPLLRHLEATYTPQTLPVHVIVPSMIGFGFSSYPPVDRDFANPDVAKIFDIVMRGLGFDGYVAQGGDIGSAISRMLAAQSDACKAYHLNMFPTQRPANFDDQSLDEVDRHCVERIEFFNKWEFAYNHEHATKTSTIGMICETSPIALLSWIGEKFLVWTDEDPPISTILANISLYWFTNTFPTSIYHYRTSTGKDAKPENKAPAPRKPLGYSQFAKEICPSPKSWVDQVADVTWHRRHEKGGHFAALEQPKVLWEDLSDFIDAVWDKQS